MPNPESSLFPSLYFSERLSNSHESFPVHIHILLFLPLIHIPQPLNGPFVNTAPARGDNALRLVVLKWTSTNHRDFSKGVRAATAYSIGELDAGNRRGEGVGIDGRGHDLASPGREEGDAISCEFSRSCGAGVR